MDSARDRLTRYLKPGQTLPDAPVAAPPDEEADAAPLTDIIPDEYVAFETHDRAIAFDVLRAANVSRSPSYHYLLDISFGTRFFTAFRLYFTYMTIKVTGENLKEVVDAFRLRRCTCIREYHPHDYPSPPPAGAPLIKKIEIIVKPLHENLAEGELEP